MTIIRTRSLSVTAAIACLLALSAPANAALFTVICQDLACSVAPIIVDDNSARDTNPTEGVMNVTVAAFGYTLGITTQSNHVLGSAPQLDLTFTATTGSAVPTSIFLLAAETNWRFVGGSFLLTLGGTNSGDSGTETGRAEVGLALRPFELIGTVGPLSGAAFSGSSTGGFTPNPTFFPYALQNRHGNHAFYRRDQYW